MKNTQLLEKWGPVLEHSALDSISDSHRKSVTATLLENTEIALLEGQSYSPQSLLSEDAHVNNTGNVQNYDPVLINLVRRAMPNLVAYDIAGVQPMTGPTGLIFAMRSNYVDSSNTEVKTEAFYNEADTDFTGTGTHGDKTGDNAPIGTGTGMSTQAAEALGDGIGDDFAQMSFQIDKVSVTAKSRALTSRAPIHTKLSHMFLPTP